MSENDQIRQLMESMHQLKRIAHHRMEIGGLNRSEFSMLMSIYHLEEFHGMGTVRVSDLSKMNEITMPATSQMLNHLEKKGMIERKPSKEDRRKVSVHITPAGQKTLEESFCLFNRMIEMVVDRLGGEDVEQLIRLLSKLYSVIEELYEHGFETMMNNGGDTCKN